MSSFALVLLLLFVAPTLSITRNECGGTNVLSAKVNVICDASTVSNCPFGTTMCHGDAAVMCIPDCSITTRKILDILKTTETTLNDVAAASQQPQCLNGGREDVITSKCVCPHYYSGDRCEVVDPCVDVDCGLNGFCSSGVCVCDPSFAGSKCEIKSDCQLPNFEWTGTVCRCISGYTGDACDACLPNLVCIPGDFAGSRYTPVTIQNKQLIEELLTQNPPPPYTVKPYVPTTSQSCACMLASPTTLSALSSPLHGDDDDDDNDDHDEHDHGHGYIHGYYGHYYTPSDQCYQLEEYLLLVAVVIVVMVLIFIGCKIYSNRTRLELPQQKSSPQPRSPKISNSRYPPHLDDNWNFRVSK